MEEADEMNSKTLSDGHQKYLVLAPLVVLAIMILIAQGFIVGPWVQERKISNEVDFCPQTLCIVAYNYNRDVFTASVTLYNAGSKPLTITNVVYDGNMLTEGFVGAPNDPTIQPLPGPAVSANDIIFPAANQWNMNTEGPTTPTILPGGIATLYLGVSTFNTASPHILKILVQGGSYSFVIESQPLG
jgi:archaellum component FlaF (FlaF/FlaG flagellin family)